MRRHPCRWPDAVVFLAILAVVALPMAPLGCSGGGDAVAVPDLLGMNEDDAVAAVQSTDLVWGGAAYAHDDEAEVGHVFQQDPLPGTLVDPGSEIHVTVSEGPAFYEEFPAWNIPDPAVVHLEALPDHLHPGETVELLLTIANAGSGACDAGEVRLCVDDVLVDVLPFPELTPGGSVDVGAMWTGDDPGQHTITAEILPHPDHMDARGSNSQQTALLWVSGEEVMTPYLEVDLTLDPPHPSEGAPTEVLLTIRNPSYAYVTNLAIACYIDEEPVGDFVLENLDAGEDAQFLVPWESVTRGEHVVVAEIELPDSYALPTSTLTRAWTVIVPDVSQHYSLIQPHHWICIGPTILANEANGRLNAIACHPTNSGVLYASAPAGVFRSTDAGSTWKSMCDKLPRNDATAIAVDPQNGQIVYATTGSFGARSWLPDAPLLKSIDGGTTWHEFATGIATGAGAIVVRRTSTGDVLVYLGTSTGLLRYQSSNPAATTSAPAEWEQILGGVINEIAVHPTNNAIVYASVHEWITRAGQWEFVFDTVYKTTNGGATAGSVVWNTIINGLPAMHEQVGYSVVLDIYRSNPQILYASVRIPGPHKVGGVNVYRSPDAGATWNLQFTRRDQHDNDISYNPLIRIHPTKEVVYYGGVKTYKAERSQTGTWSQFEVQKTHADLKDLAFDPHNADSYYVTNDGGIWYGKSTSGLNEIPAHRNSELRSLLFFDIDVARTRTDLLIGGTQDNGTVRYDGATIWSDIRGGDGMYSVIAPSNHNVMYSQHQKLADTWHSIDGGVSWPDRGPGTGLSTLQRWNHYNAFITVHPNDPDTVMAQGFEVVESTDGSKTWSNIGPTLSPTGHYVRRIVVQPTTFTRMVGTSRGQIWYRAASQWFLARSHPKNASVVSMTFAPTNHKVLYVVYSSSDPYYRVERLEQNPTGGWDGTWITDNLPVKYMPSGENLQIRGIAGDGHTDGTAYVATSKGVYRWRQGEPTYKSWKPYNDGFPLVNVVDLVVGPPPAYHLYAATWGRAAWAVVTGP